MPNSFKSVVADAQQMVLGRRSTVVPDFSWCHASFIDYRRVGCQPGVPVADEDRNASSWFNTVSFELALALELGR